MAPRLTRRPSGVPEEALPATAPVPGVTFQAELRALWRLAWPVVLSNLGAMGMGVVDTVMTGAFGGQALAAVALATTWGWGVAVVGRNVAKGLDPLVAQAFGAGAHERARRLLVQAVVLGLALSLPVALLHLVAAPGLALLGQPAALLSLAGQYAAVLALGVPMMMLVAFLQQFFQALGIVRPFTVAVVLANLLNAGLNLLLMHGVGAWPGLGPIGCAWSSVIGMAFMLAVVLLLTRRELARWWPGDWRRVARDRAGLRAVLVLGLPVGMQIAIETWGFQFAGVMVGWLGEAPLAAHSVVMNLATVSFMVPLGIGAAAATRVGHQVGAGQPWGRAAATALSCGAGVMLLSAGLFSTFPGRLAGLYTQDAAVLSIAVLLLPVAGTFQLFDGLQAVGFGVLRGLADVRVPALINILAYWLLGLPLGWALAFPAGLGARGLWVGLVVSLALVATSLLIRIAWLHRRGVRRVGEGEAEPAR
ncbi:MATE family efflux transporter [Myxococcota bacterium]|nr:MATE family efflux transporter [Myxococcota bacterium]